MPDSLSNRLPPSAPTCASPRHLPLTALIFLAWMGTLAGCSPCQDYCEEVGDVYQDCLSEWGLTWGAMGALDGREQWVDQCQIDETTEAQGLSDEDAAAREDTCSEAAGSLSAVENCEEAFSVLQEIAVAF